eukprot:CFRG2584T1
MIATTENLSAPATTIEFAVQLNGEECVKEITNVLSKLGVEVTEANAKTQKLVVTTALPSTTIHAAIAGTGRQAVVRGCSAPQGANLGTAVCMILGASGTSADLGTAKTSVDQNGDVSIGMARGISRGLVRFVQVSEHVCVVDGAVSGLTKGVHGVRVNTYGDITNGCASTGPVYTNKESGEAVGNLGDFEADVKGHASFKFVSKNLKVCDIIGRSVVIDASVDSPGNRDPVACGLIARSAGVGENTKRVCACSGKTLWEEGADEYY